MKDIIIAIRKLLKDNKDLIVGSLDQAWITFRKGIMYAIETYLLFQLVDWLKDFFH